MTATIKLPWPAPILSPNDRSHWSQKAKAKRKARYDAAACALAAGVRHIDADGLDVRITFHAPDRRARDTDNMLASSKAALDGIADVVGVDDSRWNLHIARGDIIKGGAVHVEVEVVR